MGIKDNFSQAVKELWKKDGQNDNSAQKPAQPSELDKYLRQQDEQQAKPPVQNASVEVNSSGVPLETPYYPNQAGAAQQNVQPNVQQQQVQTPPPPAPESVGGVNQNVRNAQQAAQAQQAQFGQNVQNNPQNPGQNTMGAAAPTIGAGGVGVTGGMGGYGQGAPAGNGVQGYQGMQGGQGGQGGNGGYGQGGNGGYGQGGYVPQAPQASNETEEITIISKNTAIDGNVRSLANMQIDGNIKGNVETTRNIDMSGKIIGDITCNNAGMNSAAMQGNVSLKGRMKMDRDTILIGDLSSQYADINGRIRGKLDIVGKAELKRDAIVFGDINASTIAVTDGAIIQGYVNTTFLSKEDSRNVFPDAISLDSKEGKTGAPSGTPNS